MQVWNALHAARWKYRTQKWRKNRHLRTIAQLCRAESSQLRHVSIIGKKRVKQQYLLHMSSQYDELRPTGIAAKIGSEVWGTPANFNGFRVLASLLQRRRSPEVDQTLHDVPPCPGLLHYVYIFGSSCPLMEFRHVQNSLCVQVSHCPILAALLHGTPAKLCGVVQGMELWNFRRGRQWKFAIYSIKLSQRAAITLGIGPHSSCF